MIKIDNTIIYNILVNKTFYEHIPKNGFIHWSLNVAKEKESQSFLEVTYSVWLGKIILLDRKYFTVTSWVKSIFLMWISFFSGKSVV